MPVSDRNTPAEAHSRIGSSGGSPDGQADAASTRPRSEAESPEAIARLWQALAEVVDPEIPTVSVVDMGMVHQLRISGDGLVRVEILPTFSGCPALAMIADTVRARLARVPGVHAVDVVIVHDPPWSSDRISPEGRARLKDTGIAPAPPTRGRPLSMLGAEAVHCPYCGSPRTTRENLFGPTPCRSLYHCRECLNPFERFKAI